jgi:hypothetical protein
MKIESIRLSDLKPAPYNPRTISDAALAALKASIDRWGIVQPIIFNRTTGNVVGGHQRLKVLQTEGASETDCVIVELPAAEERALNVSLNNPQAQGEFTADISELIESIKSELPELPNELALDELLGNSADIDIAPGAAIYPDDKIIDAAFAHYRAAGFPYRAMPVFRCMEEINKLSRTSTDELLNCSTATQVPDSFHPHRYHAAAAGMKSPYESFNDDKLLRRALANDLEFKGTCGNGGYIGGLSTVSGTQACSNFRPGFACWVYRRYCKPGAVVLDSSTGYGGRLTGFLAALGLSGRYIGVDPNTATYSANKRMAEALGASDVVELINLPAEDVDLATVAGRCDFAFTSPPYFSKEHYSDEPTQSWKRYPDGEQWRSGFLCRMLALQFAALKPGSKNVVNIADVMVKGKRYPLAQWTVDAAIECGFKYLETKEFPLRKRFGDESDEIATEPLLVFEKP